MPGRPTIWIIVGQGPIALAVGVVWTVLLSPIFSPFSPSLWEAARYRLKYCLKGPLNPKQPTYLDFTVTTCLPDCSKKLDMQEHVIPSRTSHRF